VFISYAQERGSEAHGELVRQLWLFLRAHGIDAHMDLVAAGRRQDWALWMADQIRQADHILIVASPAYRARAQGQAGSAEGRGVQWEARLIRDAFYADQHNLSRFVPVILPDQSVDGVPDFLAPATSTTYEVREFAIVGAEALLRLLTGQPSQVQPPLGPRPILPPDSPERRKGRPASTDNSTGNDHHPRERTANEAPNAPGHVSGQIDQDRSVHSIGLRDTATVQGDVCGTSTATGAIGEFASTGLHLGDLNRPTGVSLRTRYRQQVLRIAPTELHDREDELAALERFCTHPATAGRYWWWRAQAWSGKSAMLSWFVLHPPVGVQIVSFFITARLANQNDRIAFIDNVLEQLLALLGQRLPPFLTDTTREAYLLDLLAEAAEVCQRRGEQFVLVVDGLDEDRWTHAGVDWHSIAAVLPVCHRRGCGWWWPAVPIHPCPTTCPPIILSVTPRSGSP
jgi:hypothetical protein